MDILWAFLLCVCTVPVFGDNASSKARSCSDVRQFYSGKGFSLSGVPHTEISGEHLRICPQGYTCCTSEMEEELSTMGRRDVEGLVKEAGRSLQISLTGQYKIFEGHFLDLVNSSENSLQESFRVTYGSLYSQITRVFRDLYSELRRYYRSSSVNLEEVLNEFWARLLEHLFKASNSQYAIGDEYLECAAKQAEMLRPFGDTPRDLKFKVTRAFFASRSFIQGLVVSGELVRKVSLVPLSPECTRAIMKLMYCPHCRGMGSTKPCTNYCRNVMKGCLANQADLDTEWKNLVGTMLQVAERFKGPSSVDMVMASLPFHISEAIMTMQENVEVFTNKVFQACGIPRLSDGAEETRNRGNGGKTLVEDKISATTGARLEKLVPLSPECTRAIMKLMYCPHCRGMGSTKPCTNYCRNVMKGCLANQADLDTEWKNLVGTMLQVAERFKGPSSVDMVMASLPFHISEAIMTMQENVEVFTNKVFQACGIPRLSDGAEETRNRGNGGKTLVEDKISATTGARLEKLVSNVTGKLRDMQQYWIQLPGTLCSNRVAAGPANEDKCWNGMTRGTYLPEVMGDGLASQINNPEVEIDITKPDMTIRQQIMQLKIMTNRLKHAFNGYDVDFQDTSDDVSGSGSGMCADELCPRGPRVIVPNTDQPRLYAYPPENKKVIKGTGSQILPCHAVLLLSLAMLLLRR